MVRALTERKFITLRAPQGLVQEYQACGLNSIITILDSLGYSAKVSSDELKEIFAYSEDGIADENHRFRKLNQLLNTRRIPYRFSNSRFTATQDLVRALSLGAPVPVYFQMKILNFTKQHYKTGYQIQFGDVFQDDNRHVLLLVGYEGDTLYFVDPSYQLPWLPDGTTDLKAHFFPIKAPTFYECARYIKTYIDVRHAKADAVRYKREQSQKDTQRRLND